MTDNKLPTWTECNDLMEKKTDLTALEYFIYTNEPADDDVIWRVNLQKALDEYHQDHMLKTDQKLKKFAKMLTASRAALISYKYGNSSEELADEIIKYIEDELEFPLEQRISR